MYQRVRAYVEKYHMLTDSDKVIAGVSGGADSICLLFILKRLQEEVGFEMRTVHVHHGLRGPAADADAEYVRKICGQEDIPLSIVYKDVRKYARRYGLTVEEAGREVRRAVFKKELETYGGTKIALAHHLNDNAETVLWNLCRGTGLKGLGGIAPVSGVWIHPLLCLKRKEIESYLKKWGISYCTDETNLDSAYTRNKIRNEVMPYLEMNLNEQAAVHMSETAEQMRALGEYITAETARYKEACTEERKQGQLVLTERAYQRIPEALKPYVLHGVICTACGHQKDIGAVHVRLTEELLGRQVGRCASLPYGMEAVRCYEGICFRKREEGEAEIPEVPEGRFSFRVWERDDSDEVFPENPYTKWFDYDIIKNTVKIRHRQPGDYLTIDKAGHRQKLKQYFINEKIPQDIRKELWLAADGPHVMWIVGYRQNQMYQVTERTRRILEIQFYEGGSYGRDGRDFNQ